MDAQKNPFFELYVGEKIAPSDFVEVFSPTLVGFVDTLFAPGNVVLRGTQGSGKSMLLSLLRSDLRREYARSRRDFPVTQEARRFVGAGINLSTCGVLDFGERPIASNGDNNSAQEAAFFADYVNYWIIIDILRSIETLHELEGVPGHGIGIDLSERSLRAFSELITKDDCWLGYFKAEQGAGYQAFSNKLRGRISAYRRFLSFNTDTLPDDIINTKTSIGEPISAVAEAMWESGIVPRDVRFFVNIDQFEELANFDIRGEGTRYRRVINRALANRLSKVNYRIGSRKHAWLSGVDLDDAGAKLELDRNYKVIDIDDLLRRKENAKWIFPMFAKDVFRRRLSFAQISYGHADKDPLTTFLGRGPTPEERASHYARKSPERVVRPDRTWPRPWVEFLINLAVDDPLSARLGEAWARQKGGKSRVVEAVPTPPYPWDKVYWRKERVEQALMQIAGRCSQRQIWSGADDVIELSGSNILVFLSLCQGIWARGLASRRMTMADTLEKVSVIDQTVAIYDASEDWFGKILQETGQSKRRQRFVARIGSMFYKFLYEDNALSYPGHNGFSIADADLAAHPEIQAFLYELADYGNLFQTSHRTKEKDRQPRTKWYLHPILCPRFRIPHNRTKEPIYARASEVAEWMNDDGGASPDPDDKQLSLF